MALKLTNLKNGHQNFVFLVYQWINTKIHMLSLIQIRLFERSIVGTKVAPKFDRKDSNSLKKCLDPLFDFQFCF